MGHSTTLDDLKQIDVFTQVNIEALSEFLPQIEKLTIQPDQTLLSPESENMHIYALLQGEFLICLQANGQRPVTYIKPSDCVGEISIIDDRPPSAYVITMEECEVLSIHRDVLTRMFETQANLAVNLLKLLGERFRQNNNILVSSMELQEEYRNRAERDELTGLHNRSWMNEVFPRQLELSHRIGQQVAMMMIDADHFKQINDVHGHQVGDQALQHLADIIANNLRETDLLVRFGGEELVVLMPGTTASKAQVVAERVRSLVEITPLTTEQGQQLPMSISLGLSLWREGETVKNLIERADRAMYAAKQEGRNRVHLIS